MEEPKKPSTDAYFLFLVLVMNMYAYFPKLHYLELLP